MTDLDRLLQLHGSNGKMFNELKTKIEGQLEKSYLFDKNLANGSAFFSVHTVDNLERENAKLKEELAKHEDKE